MRGRRLSPEHLAKLKARPGRRIPVEERFWSKVDRTAGPGACWPWIANRSRLGYGLLRVTRARGVYRQAIASRISLEMHLGRHLLPHELACHTCDNPPCVNPAHLFVGDKQANGQDASTKGRTRGARGEAHRLARFTAEQVLAIRAEHAGGAIVAELHRKYGGDYKTIRAIVLRKTWRHI